MVSINFTWLCGDERRLIPWSSHRDDLGRCFRDVAVICPVYAVLALASSFYLGNRSRHLLRTSFHLRVLTAREIIVVGLLLCPLVKLTTIALFLKEDTLRMLPRSTLIGAAVEIFGWLVHLYFVIVLKTRVSASSCRGPVAVLWGWLLTVIVTCLDVRTIFIADETRFIHGLHDNDSDQWLDGVVYLQGALQVLYFCTLIPSGAGQIIVPQRLVNLAGSMGTDSFSESYVGLSTTPANQHLGVAEMGSHFLSRLALSWVEPLLQKGCTVGLNSADDLFDLPGQMKTAYVDTKFWIVFRDLQLRGSLEMEKERLLRRESLPRTGRSRHHSASEKAKPISLLRALLRNFFTEYFALGVLKFICDVSGFVGPLLLNAIVTYIASQKIGESSAFYYVAALFAVSLFSSVCTSQYAYLLNNLKIKVRSSLVSTIYRKTLHLRSSSMASFSIGEIDNFMGLDTDRIMNICDSVHAILIQPIHIAVCLYLLHQQVGIAYMAGVAFAVLLIPINHWIARKIGNLTVSLMKPKDGRVKVMTELLYGVKVVKYYSWEEHLWNRITALRKAEVKSLKGIKYLDAFCVFFWATSPIIIAALTFTTYLLLGNQLTVAKVFTCLALFNMLIVPLNAFPWVIGGVVQGYVSLKRVEKLVQVEEANLTKCYVPIDEASGVALFVRNCHFIWNRNAERQLEDQSDRNFRLEDINFEVNRGQLVGVCGPVGSGKSSLLMALLSEMECVSGEIGSSSIADGFALVADEPWIQNASIKENILFGRAMQLERYGSVVSACALDVDLKVFPAGDETFIGERGINLSGGQKTRVALARALYQDKDIYLIDDIFSALDVHVAEHIVHHVLHGLLAHKTRILCTHHQRYLTKANWILLMKDGKIFRQGEPALVLEVRETEKLKLEENGCGDGKGIPADWKLNDSPSKKGGHTSPSDDVGSSAGVIVPQTHEEEIYRGSVQPRVYGAYAKGMGYVMGSIIVLSLVTMQALKNVSDWWLAYWLSEDPPRNTTNGASIVADSGNNGITTIFGFYLTVYCILIGSNAAVSLVRAFSFAYGAIRAAISFHDKLLRTILKASTQFFDVTPVGRIVNRFSFDTWVVDDDMPFSLNILLAQIVGLIGTLSVICLSLPWLLLLIVPLTGVYLNVQYYYRHTSRELKRLDAVSLSPIYSHFTETVLGLTTIRAFRAEARFKRDFEERLERNQKIRFSLGAIVSWLTIRLQLIGVAVVTGVGFVAILEHNIGGVDAGLVGLALSYGLSITSILAAVVQMFTEIEKKMVSVERVLQYINGIEPERWEGFTKPPRTWPSRGVVAFHDVQLRYRQNLPYALDKVTFSTQPAEKLGIVGRTGAGKSSLFTALFRLVEVENGGITIDDQVVSFLDIVTLRSHVTIIPQDPFIFSGTVRVNLDPANLYSDDDVWAALGQCHLEALIRRYGGLDIELVQSGLEFSMGQRQLLCLARAILAKTKILCIDEATASIDGDTDRLLQKTIRTAFADSTVLTIAHRLDTVLDSDRILVMGRGTVLELDTPQALLANTLSHFHRLVRKQEWLPQEQ